MAPDISAEDRSPIFLRPRPQASVAPDAADVEYGPMEDLTATDDISPGAEYVTPLRPLPQHIGAPRRPRTAGEQHGLRSGLCAFTIQDFQPGASPPSVMLRQLVGPYHPWLHECGEETCPSTEQPLEVTQARLQAGHPPSQALSSGNHIRVDHRAFPKAVHVRVRLDTLGVDSTLWPEVDSLSGTVVDRCYHDIHGAPMFGVDLGGMLGRRELKVYDAELDPARQCGGSTQRTLAFDGAGTSTQGDGAGPSSVSPFSAWQPLSPTYNSDQDKDWQAEPGDFEDGQGSGMQGRCPSFTLML